MPIAIEFVGVRRGAVADGDGGQPARGVAVADRDGAAAADGVEGAEGDAKLAVVSTVLRSPTAVPPVAPAAVWLPVPTAVLKPPAAITSRVATPPLPIGGGGAARGQRPAAHRGRS